MGRITAIEISKNLPMRVKSLDDNGLFKGKIIRFYQVNKYGRLLGRVVGSYGCQICVLSADAEFETLK